MKVIARWNEDISWIKERKFKNYCIVQKDVDLPNVGREPSSYLWWIIQNYDKLPKEVHFLQANPFDHVDENLESKWWAESDKTGSPHHPGLSIEPLASILGLELPDNWTFPAGACFKVPQKEIKKYPLDWYKKALTLCNEYPQGPWIFERLWPLMYKIIQKPPKRN